MKVSTENTKVNLYFNSADEQIFEERQFPNGDIVRTQIDNDSYTGDYGDVGDVDPTKTIKLKYTKTTATTAIGGETFLA